jgi:anaerobic selenocysteine-containing dehydrogenase
MFHSEHRQAGIGMREKHPDPLVTIHPETARQLGIADGEWVWIETRRGRIRQRAKLDPGILPDVVNCEASWWFPEQPGEDPCLFGVFQSNANVLTRTPMSSATPDRRLGEPGPAVQGLQN